MLDSYFEKDSHSLSKHTDRPVVDAECIDNSKNKSSRLNHFSKDTSEVHTASSFDLSFKQEESKLTVRRLGSARDKKDENEEDEKDHQSQDGLSNDHGSEEKVKFHVKVSSPSTHKKEENENEVDKALAKTRVEMISVHKKAPKLLDFTGMLSKYDHFSQISHHQPASDTQRPRENSVLPFAEIDISEIDRTRPDLFTDLDIDD